MSRSPGLLRAVVTQSACLFVPTSAVPVSPQVGGFLWHDDDVAHTRFDGAGAPGAHVGLDGLVRLYRMDHFALGTGHLRCGALALRSSVRRHKAMVRLIRGRATDRRANEYDCRMSDFLSIEDTGAIRTLSMSNPGRRNAVPPTGWEDFSEAFRAFEESDQRVLVITGVEGDFCAGADMNKEIVESQSAADNATRMRLISRAVTRLHRLTKPTVAAVDGVAVGAGMNLALGCDIIIATDRARFAEIFVKRGLTLDFGGTWLLPRLIGLARARELALTGRIVDAAEALEIGLVNRVVTVDEFESTVADIASTLAAGAPLAQSIIKRALDRSSSMSFEQALAFEEHAQAILLGSEDLVEGASAFVEKRTPDFRGR
ncbi:MAG: hypothetical protein BMS9Abin17_0537 [Acidimicrobiia bacterium]|nr:MAG: hypothetical protein BMS9Abin17_0537 [Acidimicrobiia bacterium]